MCTNPFYIRENFEGGLVDTLKRQGSQISFQLVQTTFKLIDIYKRQVTDKLMTSLNLLPRDKAAIWTLLIQ